MAEIVSVTASALGRVSVHHASAATGTDQKSIKQGLVPNSRAQFRPASPSFQQIVCFFPDLSLYDRGLLAGIDLTAVAHFADIEHVREDAYQCRSVEPRTLA